MEVAYVYILLCANAKYYTGSTVDLDKRIHDHQEGLGANFTRKYLPFTLVYVEIFERIDQAFKREKQIQGWSHNKKKALIESNFNSLRTLSECQNSSHTNNIYSHDINDTPVQNDVERRVF